MKSKLQKYLKQECNRVFSVFLDEEDLEETKKGVKDVTQHFNDASIETIRDSKRMLNIFFEKQKINNLNASTQ